MNTSPATMLTLTNSECVAIVDADRVEELLPFCWRLDRDGYVLRTYQRGRPQFLHRLITKAPPGMFVDHIDRNPLDNRIGNLRVVTPTESTLNKGRRGGTSRFRGVAWAPKSRKWQVYLNRRYIGTFDNEFDAAATWLCVASRAYGEINVARDREVLAAAMRSR